MIWRVKFEKIHSHADFDIEAVSGVSEGLLRTTVLWLLVLSLVWFWGLEVSGRNESVPLAAAVNADSPHVYFILRLGCLVSLSSNVINAASQDPAAVRLMNSSAASHSPPSYSPSSRCQIKTGWQKSKKTFSVGVCVFILSGYCCNRADFLTING